MCDWILEHCGDEVPVHFTAFHPDFRMRDRPNTPHATLLEAHEVARRAGLKYVYTGNVDDVAHQSTYCPHCTKLLIERNWYELGAYHLQRGPLRPLRRPRRRPLRRATGRPGAADGVPVDIARFAPDGRRRIVHQIQPGPADEHRHPRPRPVAECPPTTAAAPELTPEQRAAILHAAAEFVAAAIRGRPATLARPRRSPARPSCRCRGPTSP